MLRRGLTTSLLLIIMAGSHAVRAAEVASTPPTPNTVDLSAFLGYYQGVSKVSLDSGALHLGSAKTRIRQTSPHALTIAAAASIRTSNRTISIGNRLDFSAEGLIRVLDLAPGILEKTKLSGIYTAVTPRMIEFSGTYVHGKKISGHFSGFARIGRRGNFTLRYSIFPVDSTVAAFVYQYTGRTSVKQPKN